MELETFLFFYISIIGLVIMLPIHILSVEHIKFNEKYGKKNGERFTKILAIVSGWGFFMFLIGLWISPQPKLIIPYFYDDLLINISILNIEISIFYLLLSFPCIIIGAYLGISGVKEITLKVSETHRPKEIISSGIYSKIRHPQYLGAILAHIGFSILLASLFSLILTPIIIFYNYIISWKEEHELIKEFGDLYKEYKNNVPMFIPKVKIA